MISASGLISCGFWCTPPYVWAGNACSTGCPGSCPNASVCIIPQPQASITASPRTVSVPVNTAGTTRICWRTQGLNYPVWIRVQVNGAPGALFTRESDPGEYCEDAAWIVAGNSYQFSIRTSNNDTSTLLASVTVTGVLQASPPDAGIVDSGASGPGFCGPTTCPPGQSCHCGDFCRTTGTDCP